jgi:hypothetical protein
VTSDTEAHHVLANYNEWLASPLDRMWLHYARAVLRRAFTQALGPIDLWAGLGAAVLGVVDHYMPWAKFGDALAWQIPIWALAAVMATRLFMAPYWIFKEQTSKISDLTEKLRPKIIVSALHQAVDTSEGFTRLTRR